MNKKNDTNACIKETFEILSQIPYTLNLMVVFGRPVTEVSCHAQMHISCFCRELSSGPDDLPKAK